MRNDLISRMALMEEIEHSFIIPILKMNLRPEHEAVLKIREIIMNMPTAFDKEKVLEKIKDESRSERLEDVGISGNVYGYNIERVINEEDVIEIVEKGGIE